MNLMQDKKPSSFLEKFLRCVYQNSIPVFVYKCAQLMKQKIEVRPMVQWWLTPSLFRGLPTITFVEEWHAFWRAWRSNSLHSCLGVDLAISSCSWWGARVRRVVGLWCFCGLDGYLVGFVFSESVGLCFIQTIQR